MKKENLGWIILLFVGIFLLPLRNINWGRFSINNEQVTVTGEAKTRQANQMATYNAGVSVVGKDKQKVVDETNQKMNDLVESLKAFGIAKEDIKTQSMNINEEEIYPSKAKQWRAYNGIEIILRDIKKDSELNSILTKSGATNVYGPNYTIDDTNSIAKTLYDDVIKDAREKAEAIAKASGRKLGKVLTVSEGASSVNYPMYKMLDSSGRGGAEAAALEPGSTTVGKSLIVSFELR